jgi:hypothetical protein
MAKPDLLIARESAFRLLARYQAENQALRDTLGEIAATLAHLRATDGWAAPWDGITGGTWAGPFVHHAEDLARAALRRGRAEPETAPRFDYALQVWHEAGIILGCGHRPIRTTCCHAGKYAGQALDSVRRTVGR